MGSAHLDLHKFTASQNETQQVFFAVVFLPIKHSGMTRVSQLMLVLMLAPLMAVAKPRLSTPPPSDWKYVAKRLKLENFDADFIKQLRTTYDDRTFAEVLELNTLLFLKKSDYHGIQVNDEAADTVREFMQENRAALDIAEKTYGVSGGVVASLLWMESRHGKNLGTFHVPSVFVDLVQADRPVVMLYLHKAAKRFTKRVTVQDRTDIDTRAKKRVKWAVSELRAIEKMYRRNPKLLPTFPGSFAGAFGMAQFEPSSYVHYARAQTGDHPPVLENADDAIQSVAYYLHKSGWHAKRKKSYVRALMRYNNSHDYANAILKLARQASDAKRGPASKKHRRKSRST
jgi:membrane-bound lytic murein transglycosylase B